MAGEIDINTVAKAYARWAPVYDFVFGAVFDAGRKASIAAAERVGGRILDVGIGTGISLTDYAPPHRIVGVDYCEPMLRKAHERVAEHKLAHVEALAVMDAQHLGFPDAFFDAVVAQYVITTVPDPEAALDEFARVTKAGGEIILVNHLGAEAGPRRGFEQSFAPGARGVGWRPEFRVRPGAAGGGGPRRRGPARTPPQAAARTFLADPLRAAGGRERAGQAWRGWRAALTVRAHGREAVCAAPCSILVSKLSRANVWPGRCAILHSCRN